MTCMKETHGADDLFRELLHNLMTGEIRVADLNLSSDYADGA